MQGLRARAITKAFKGTPVLRGIDLDIERGTIAAITGSNGAGKTTLLRVFATLLRPDGGNAWVDGFDVDTELDQVRNRIGVALVNERALYWRLSGLENLIFFARLSGLPPKIAKAKAIALADRLGIEPLLQRRASALSAGQRQRLILARALIAEPPVLLLDEPLRGLDANATERTCSILKDAARNGATIAVATPQTQEAALLADVTIELRTGQAGAGATDARTDAPTQAGAGATDAPTDAPTDARTHAPTRADALGAKELV